MRDVCQFVLTLTAASVPSGQVQVVGGLQSPQGPFRPLPRKSPRLQVGEINREGRGQNMHFFHHVFIGRNIDLPFLLCDRGSISTSASCWTNSCSTRVPVIILNIIVNLSILKKFNNDDIITIIWDDVVTIMSCCGSFCVISLTLKKL